MKEQKLKIGKTIWVIAEGYIPKQGKLTEDEYISHETACILNANNQECKISLIIFFKDKDPCGPYLISIPAKRTKHVRFNDLTIPVPIPLETDFSCVIESNIPIVVQHTRLDSRHPDLSLMTTMAYPIEGS